MRSATDGVRSQLSPDGIAYLLRPDAFRLRRALSRETLPSAATILHIPDVTRSRHLAPTGTEAERYALSGRLAMGSWKRRAASGLLRLPLVPAFGPTGIALRRVPSPPLARWLFDVDAARAGSVLLTPTGTGAVVRRFSAGGVDPDVVAKVSTRSEDERRALQTVAPEAGRAGVRVPRVVSAGLLGETPFVIESALGGRSAALLIQDGRLPAGRLQVRVADWLERWSRSSLRVRDLGVEDLERAVLIPATRLVSRIEGYLAYVRALCSQAIGTETPLVASHGDLTAANILVGASGDLGIVDWENGVSESLPLMDFFYSAADLVAAEHGYEDRVRAFRACFAESGAHASLVEDLRRRIADALRIPDAVQELSFHACWLHHADNEARRATPSHVGPFATILHSVASDPRRYAHVARSR